MKITQTRAYDICQTAAGGHSDSEWIDWPTDSECGAAILQVLKNAAATIKTTEDETKAADIALDAFDECDELAFG